MKPELGSNLPFFLAHCLELEQESAERLREFAAADFYATVAAQSDNPEIVKHAADFAEEEREHARLLQARLQTLPGPENTTPPAPDIDPAHQPE